MKRKKETFLGFMSRNGIKDAISLENAEILDRLVTAAPANEGDYPAEALESLYDQGLITDVFNPEKGWQVNATPEGAEYHRDSEIAITPDFQEDAINTESGPFDDNSRKIIEDQADEVSLEEIMPYDKRNRSFGDKAIIALAGMMMTIPKMTFDLADVDMTIVEKMKKYPDLLEAVSDWILQPDQGHLPMLLKAHKVFSPMQKRSNAKRLYRGFRLKGTEQQALGLKVKGFFKSKPANFEVGSEMEYVSETNAISFTEYESTATAFGNAIVSIDYNRYKRRCFWLDPNIYYAIDSLNYPDLAKKRKFWYYYGEYILLPSKEPIEFKIEAFGKQKAK